MVCAIGLIKQVAQLLSKCISIIAYILCSRNFATRDPSKREGAESCVLREDMLYYKVQLIQNLGPNRKRETFWFQTHS